MPEGSSQPPPAAPADRTLPGEAAPAPARWTFGRRLALVYGLVALVIFLGVGAFGWWQAAILSARSKELALAETRGLAEQVGSGLEQARQAIAILATRDVLADGPAGCTTVLQSTHIAMAAMVRTLAVVDTDGLFICATEASLPGRPISSGLVRTAILVGRPVTGALIRSSLDGGTVVGIAQLIRRSGRRDHVITASVTVAGLRESIQRHLPRRDDLRVWIYDTEGNSVGLVGPPGAAPMPEALQASYTASSPTEAGLALSGGRLLVQARATENLSVVVSLPEDALRAGGAAEIALPPILLALVLLGGLAALFWSVQRFIVAPLEFATRRLETPAGALPPADGDGRGSAEIDSLIRRLDASRTTREGAIQLRDLLLREAHHRIKNHLALVVSILRLQERQLSDHAALQALRAAQGRILAIGVTYELLQHGPGQLVALDTLLERFARAVPASGQGDNAAAAEVLTDLAHLEAPADVAVKIALVVNEITTNALKHAFAGRGAGKVTITLRPVAGGGFSLRIADDGNGMPRDPRRGLGLTVVDNLLRGIGATIEREDGPGTAFLVTWRPSKAA